VTVSTSRRARTADIATYIAYGVICLFFAAPLLWLVSLSIRTSSEVYVSDLRLWPKDPTLQNYLSALANPLFATYLWNGLKLSVAGALGAMLFATPAAYGLSRFRFRHRHLVMIGLLAFQMISPLVIMVPLYRYMDRLYLTDSHFGAAMLYIAIAAPLFTWMLKGFLDGIPQTLEDAAMIDGCTRFGAFMRVVLPLSLPGLTSAFVLTAILGWSQFIIPFILISKPALQPIAVGIFNFQGTYIDTSTQLLAAASILSI
jgi:multiple sugar transport system permease protein